MNLFFYWRLFDYSVLTMWDVENLFHYINYSGVTSPTRFPMITATCMYSREYRPSRDLNGDACSSFASLTPFPGSTIPFPAKLRVGVHWTLPKMSATLTWNAAKWGKLCDALETMSQPVPSHPMFFSFVCGYVRSFCVRLQQPSLKCVVALHQSFASVL